MTRTDLSTMRDLLLPGLWEVRGTYNLLPRAWDDFFTPQFAPATPHIWIPKISVPLAFAAGAAAAIIENPEVTRRFWAGWR
jgi:hypothetical protein